jgi:hypothetical protein
LHADGIAGDLFDSMLASPAGVTLVPLTLSSELPSKGDRLLVDGHQVGGLPADHPARVRYEETMRGRAGAQTGRKESAGGVEGLGADSARTAAEQAHDPDDPTVLHCPSAVDVLVPAAPLLTDPRMLVLPSRPLEMGQCGAPVLDAFEEVVGMVESTLTASHGKLAGAGVCVTASRLGGLVKEVRSRMETLAKRAAVADGVLAGGQGGGATTARMPGTQQLASPRLSSWAGLSSGSPYGQRPEAHAGGSAAVPFEEAQAIEEMYGRDAVRRINGPIGKGSEGTSFAQTAVALHNGLTGFAGQAAGMALAAARAAGASEPEGSAVAGRAAWLVLAGHATDPEEAAREASETLGSASDMADADIKQSSPARSWGLSAEHTARLAAVLGEDRRLAPGESIARELAHSSALAAAFAEDALATDGDSLPLSHRLALSARDSGALPSWCFAIDPSAAESAWDALGMRPPTDGGRVLLSSSTPGAGATAPDIPESLADPSPSLEESLSAPNDAPPVASAAPGKTTRTKGQITNKPTRRERRAVLKQYSRSESERV